MSEQFTPELGQMVFSNTAWEAHPMHRAVEVGLEHLAEQIALTRGEDPNRDGLLVENFGADPWESDVFAMRTYCWCDGTAYGHEDACPPNFWHRSGFTAAWYKYLGRGSSQSEALDYETWQAIMRDCLLSLPTPDQPATASRPTEAEGGEAL